MYVGYVGGSTQTLLYFICVYCFTYDYFLTESEH